MVVMAPATGVMTFVASKRPPSPTSMTATSTDARRKSSNAMAVVASKNVGRTRSVPDWTRLSARSSTSCATALNVGVSTALSPMTKRSVMSARCGDV
jgi:hypothetical protein